MSTATADAMDDAVEHDAHDDHDDHHGPTDKQYIIIAVWLGVLTALEVATAFEQVEEWLGVTLIPVLLLMMFVKFGVVAAYFMHLKFDNKVLTQLFAFGMVLATAVYVAALSAFGFWGG